MTDNELRAAIVDYLWGLSQQGKGALRQRGLAAAMGVSARRIEDAMTGDEIQTICRRKHSGYRVLLRRSLLGTIYHVSREHARADVEYIAGRWRARITKGRRAVAELRVGGADSMTLRAAEGLDSALDQEEMWLSLLEDSVIGERTKDVAPEGANF